jgi:hypothetical protein
LARGLERKGERDRGVEVAPLVDVPSHEARGVCEADEAAVLAYRHAGFDHPSSPVTPATVSDIMQE